MGRPRSAGPWSRLSPACRTSSANFISSARRLTRSSKRTGMPKRNSRSRYAGSAGSSEPWRAPMRLRLRSFGATVPRCAARLPTTDARRSPPRGRRSRGGWRRWLRAWTGSGKRGRLAAADAVAPADHPWLGGHGCALAGHSARLRVGAPGRAHPEQPGRGGRPPCPAPLRRAGRRHAPAPRQGGDARGRHRALPQGGPQLQTRAVPLLRAARPAADQQRPRASLRGAALPRAPGEWAQGGLPGHRAPWGGAPDRGHGDAAAPTGCARAGSGQPGAMERTPPASRPPPGCPDPAHPLPAQPGCLPGCLGTASVPVSFADLSSSSVVGQRMAVSLGVERSNRLVDGAVEVIRAGERLMSEVMPLEVAPETLDIVQLRSIFRQPLDGEPVGALGERGAACLAGVDRAVVEDEHEGLERDAELGTIAAVDLLQESDEVRASFGSAGLNNELATRPVEHPEQRHFGALARRWDAQVGPLLRPDVRQVRVGEGFGLVCEQEHDVARLGLGLEQLSAQARPVHGVGVLPTFQCVAGSPPAKAPFFRSTTESREREMRTPARVSISSARRGSVQFGRSATGPDRTSSATARARSALTGAGPGATAVFRASMPPVMKALRQKRTVSSRTPKASAIWPLVQPDRVSKIARARSASPRSRERLSAIRARL